MTDHMTALEAALALGIRLGSLYPLLRSQRLGATRVDGQWRIPRTVVEQRIAAQRAKRVVKEKQAKKI